MRMKCRIKCTFIILCFLFSRPHAQTVDAAVVSWHPVSGGQWARIYLKNSPFPHPSRRYGHRYKNIFFSYNTSYADSSAIVFIPDGYKPIRKLNNVVVHFHGWNNEVMNVMYKFNLIPQFVKSHKNAILILAQGPKNAMDSSGGKMEDKDGLKKFLYEALLNLRTQKKITSAALGHVIISAHSGGYRPAILGLVKGGLPLHVKEIFLFDAFYDLTDLLIPWLKSDSDHRLRSIFTAHLAPEHRHFVRMLALQHLRYENILNRNTQIYLKFTTVCHDCVMDGTFEKWLKVSILEDIER